MDDPAFMKVTNGVYNWANYLAGFIFGVDFFIADLLVELSP